MLSLSERPSGTSKTVSIRQHSQANRVAASACTNRRRLEVPTVERLEPRAIQLVQEHEQTLRSETETIQSITKKLGCSREALRLWIHHIEIDHGARPSLTSDDRQGIAELEHKNAELRRANEILRTQPRFSRRQSSTADRADSEFIGVKSIYAVLPIAPLTYYWHQTLCGSPHVVVSTCAVESPAP